MSLLVTGSIGIDTVTTPYGVSENCIGGSAVYFSMAASFFGPVRFTGVIGSDCPFDLREVFSGKDVDLEGLEVREHSKTFRWKGAYHDSMNEAVTEKVELNVLAESPPKLPDAYRDSKYLFLANTAPSLQMELLGQVKAGVFSAADTMNCWIDGHPNDLKQLLAKIDALIINEQESRMLSGQSNLIKAAKNILAMGPDVVLIKKGDSGSIMCNKKGEQFILPAFPMSEIKDPTGAGDSFAGGFMGYLAHTSKTDFKSLRKAVAYGTVVASFTISEFSLEGLTCLKRKDIDKRLEVLRKVTGF